MPKKVLALTSSFYSDSERVLISLRYDIDRKVAFSREQIPKRPSVTEVVVGFELF